MSDKYKNNSGMYIDAHTDRRGTNHLDFYDKDPRDSDHKSIHFNWDGSNGRGTITRTTDGDKKSKDIECFLTTACMRHMSTNFDDKCYELERLRWFRDNYGLEDDVKLYYEIAPLIVDEIEKMENNSELYEKIYVDVIKYCVDKIDAMEYEDAYRRYKECVVFLSDNLLKPKMQTNLVKILKKINL